MSGDGAEYCALINSGRSQPGAEGAHGAGHGVLSGGQNNAIAFRFGIRLGVRDQQLEAASFPAYVLDLDGAQFGAS